MMNKFIPTHACSYFLEAYFSGPTSTSVSHISISTQLTADDNLYCWVVPTYLMAHMDKMVETVKNIMQEEEDEERTTSTSPSTEKRQQVVERLDLAVHSVRMLVEETQRRLGVQQSLMSIHQSLVILCLVPFVVHNLGSSDALTKICGWLMVLFMVAFIGLEAAQMYAAAQIGDYYDRIILQFNAATYAAVGQRLLGRPFAVYKMLANLAPAMRMHVCGVPITSAKVGTVLELVKLALLMAMFNRIVPFAS